MLLNGSCGQWRLYLAEFIIPFWNHADVQNTMWLVTIPSKHETFELMLIQCWLTICDAGTALTSTGSTPRVCWAALNNSWSAGSAYCWRRVQANTTKCWASVAVAGQYPFSPSQYFMLAVPACWRYRHDALNQGWVNVGPPSVTLAHIQHGTKHDTVTQYWANVDSAS